MTLSNYISELVYAAAGAMLGYLLMKMDDTLNNKQYTYKEYSKFTLACYLVTLAGLLLLKFMGPVSLPGSAPGITAPTPVQLKPPQYGGGGGNSVLMPNNLQAFTTPLQKPSIPSNGTAFFQPANNTQSLRFASGTPTF